MTKRSCKICVDKNEGWWMHHEQGVIAVTMNEAIEAQKVHDLPKYHYLCMLIDQRLKDFLRKASIGGWTIHDENPMNNLEYMASLYEHRA